MSDSLQNLSQLPALEDVNLADNLICSVRWGLAGCKRLSVLNLSGNPLANLKVRTRKTNQNRSHFKLGLSRTVTVKSEGKGEHKSV